MDRVIITDIDGVALDWEGHFHSYMSSQGHQRAHETPSYWQETYYPHLSELEARKMIYHYNTSAWIMDMPTHKDSRSGIARLVDAGYKFLAVTAMGLDPYTLEARIYNLEKRFGRDVFVDVITTDMYDEDSKREPLTNNFQEGRYWIEDKPSNAVMGAEIGYNTILMNHPYNAEFDETAHGIKRVSCWAQICDLILDTDQSSSP